MALLSKKSFFQASVIGSAAKCSPRTIHRRAAREAWPRTSNGYIIEYQPPRDLLKKCQALLQRTKVKGLRGFGICIERRAETDRTLHRLSALYALESKLLSGKPLEVALNQVATAFRSNKKSLRDWAAAYSNLGLEGLLESKRGRVGRKSRVKK